MNIQIKAKDKLGIDRIRMLDEKCKKCRRTSYRIGVIASKLLSSRKSSKSVKSVSAAALNLRRKCYKCDYKFLWFQVNCQSKKP